MKRREFVQKFSVASAAAATALGAGKSLAKTPAATSREQQEHDHEQQEHDHKPLTGPMAMATVSFGEWQTTVPLDRYPPAPPIPPPPPGGGHLLIPNQVTIKVGGTVNYIISGFHQVIVYAPGTKPENINTALIRPTRGTPAGIPLINDASNRLYAGLDPSTIHGGPPTATIPLLDRVETVQFSRKGLHLVICGVLPHFLGNMYGWVKVVGNEGDD